jgi:pimeloyl-ACP methyl ester carboxylesterase
VADGFQEIGYDYRLAYELRAELVRVEGGKHFVPEDHPGPVVRAVGGVLDESAVRRGSP